MLTTLGLATGCGEPAAGRPAPLRPVEVTETRRTPVAWGHRSEAGAQPGTQPSSQARGAPTPPGPPGHARPRLRAPTPPRPARRGGGTGRGPQGQVGPECPASPAPLRWVPRPRWRVPAGGGARAQERAQQVPRLPPPPRGGEGAGRGQGRGGGGGERQEGGRLTEPNGAVGSAGCTRARGFRETPEVGETRPGARGAADAARDVCTAGRRALSSPAEARRPLLFLLPRSTRSSGERRARPPAPGPRSR